MVNAECNSEIASPSVSLPLRSRWFLPAIWICLSALYCVLIDLQIHRRVWFDELLTYYIAKAPTLSRVTYLVKLWDLNPALLHWLAHVCLLLTGGKMVAIRLPSVVAFYFTSLLLYLYSARKLSRAYAALPVLILWYSPIFVYATEARPYALLACFFCAVLLLRDLAISGQRHGWMLGGIALCSAGLLFSHVLAPLSLLPFLAAEIWRLKERRSPDYPLWTALFLPLVLVISYRPFVKNYETIIYYPLAFQATLRKLLSFYGHVFSGVAIPVCAILLAGLIATKGKWTWRVSSWPRSEKILFAALALVPVLLDLMMMYGHAPFWGRYCITSVIALYFLFAILVSYGLRHLATAGYLAVSAACLVLTIGRIIVPTVRDRLHPPPASAAFLANLRPDLPIVAASGMTFVEMGQYESREVSSRLFYLLDRSAAIQFAHATIFEDLADFQKSLDLAGHVENYTKFTHNHRDFLVFGTLNYPEDWLLRKLSSDHSVIVPLGAYETPYKDKTVFEVHLKPYSFRSTNVEDAATVHGISKSRIASRIRD